MRNMRLLRLIKNGLIRMPAPVRDLIAPRLFRSYESFVARRQAARERSDVIASGLPVPPPSLRVKVIGTGDMDVFLTSGKRDNEVIRAALARAGVVMTERGSGGGPRHSQAPIRILDWGCGCGRIIRWWSDFQDIDIYGCDYNPELVAWVKENLPFVNARVNQLSPPLPYEPGSFDVVYAISVFTHLTNDLAHDWMREVHRVLAPGGRFFFSTHGVAYRDKLATAEKARFDSGTPVVQFSSVEGSNLCAAFHPRQWIEASLLDGFQLVEMREAHLLDEGDRGGLFQDRWLIRKH